MIQILSKKLILNYQESWHPDKNPNNIKEATKKSKEISEAYDILKDNDKEKNIIVMVWIL